MSPYTESCACILFSPLSLSSLRSGRALNAQDSVRTHASCAVPGTFVYIMPCWKVGYVRISADHCIYMRNTTSGFSIVTSMLTIMAAAASNKLNGQAERTTQEVFLPCRPQRAQMATGRGCNSKPLYTHHISISSRIY